MGSNRKRTVINLGDACGTPKILQLISKQLKITIMKIKNLFFLTLTLTALLISQVSMAQIASLESWKLLGTRTVD